MILVLAVALAAGPADEYATRARPILLAAGCANGQCHGSTLAPLKLIDRALNEQETAKEAALVVAAGDAQRPLQSVLLRKAMGELDHVGGKNLERGSCEIEQLAAWLQGTTAMCTLTLRTREAPPAMQGPLPEALDPLIATCATASCHGGPAAPPLATGADARARNADRLRAFGNGFAPTDSALFAVLQGRKQHPVALKDVTGADGRALFGWMSGEPLTAPKRLPKLADLPKLMPVFEKRGCTQSTCHGSFGNGLLLGGGEVMVASNYLRLLPRIADGSLRAKTSNARAHGGGLNLAAKGDCMATQVEAWVSGQPLVACPPHPAPSRAVYDTVVQPALEALKCTSCHVKSPGGFKLVPADGNDATLASNYAEVVRFVDPDFPPVSHVLLRVREPCLQSRIIAWVAGRSQPACEVKPRAVPTP
ncbi:MAG: hypothetical protein U0228_03965 [Myxococcaceae bacterium]